MGWVLNQIWLGEDPPLEKLKATSEKTKEFGWDYRFWTWESLTSTFGFFYFHNFILSKLPEQALTFLTKFYLWHVLARYGANGMFLDATEELPLTSYNPTEHFVLPGVYMAKNYTPSFVVTAHEEAAGIARDAVIWDLDLRYRANGNYMFHFFTSLRYNVLGPRFFSNTLMPRWRRANISLFNSPKAEETTPAIPLPPAYLLPSPFHVTSISASSVSTLNPGISSKISPIQAVVPEGCTRVIVLGEDGTGLEALSSFAHYGDLLVHTHSCPFYSSVRGMKDVGHSVFYSKKEVDVGDVFMERPVIPGVSFASYDWNKEGESGSISLPIALACSYRERNPFLPICLYGHNPADDVTQFHDVELEEALIHAHKIELLSPRYSLILLYLTRRTHHIRRVLLTRALAKKVGEGGDVLYRFCCARGAQMPPNSTVWALEEAGDDEDDLDLGLKLFSALSHARALQGAYFLLLPDDSFLSPPEWIAWAKENEPEVVGKVDGDGFDLGAGIAFSHSALDAILSQLSPDVMREGKERPDILLRQVALNLDLPITAPGVETVREVTTDYLRKI